LLTRLPFFSGFLVHFNSCFVLSINFFLTSSSMLRFLSHFSENKTTNDKSAKGAFFQESLLPSDSFFTSLFFLDKNALLRASSTDPAKSFLFFGVFFGNLFFYKLFFLRSSFAFSHRRYLDSNKRNETSLQVVPLLVVPVRLKTISIEILISSENLFEVHF
jgi:hypothetical protein